MAALLKVELPGLQKTLHLRWSTPRKGTGHSPENWRMVLEQIEGVQARGAHGELVLLLVYYRVIDLYEAAYELSLERGVPPAELMASCKAHRILLRRSLALMNTATPNIVDMWGWAITHGRRIPRL